MIHNTRALMAEIRQRYDATGQPTLRRIAHEAGVSFETVRRVLFMDPANPQVNTLIRIANALGAEYTTPELPSNAPSLYIQVQLLTARVEALERKLED